MKLKVLSLSAAMTAVLGFGSFALAQDANVQTAPDGARQERGFRRHRGGAGKMHGLANLNLTEAQKQQIQQIHENAKNSFAGLDEIKQLRLQQRTGTALTAEQTARISQLREQHRAAKEQTKAQVLAVLTAEQRQQLETQKAERKENRGARGEGRRGFKRGGEFGGLNRLNLTEAQQQQLRTLNETVLSSTKTQREELRGLYEQSRGGAQLTADQNARANELRQQLRQSGEQMRANLQSVLTAEQRQQIETEREQKRQRFEQRRQLRQNTVETPQ